MTYACLGCSYSVREVRRWPEEADPLHEAIGKLRWMSDLPLDVFFEIASHLRPIDVFHLSHASKQLRKMLFSRTARFVWEAARENLDPPLPKCPVDMSEPMYAYLVFGQYCMSCLDEGVDRVDFGLRVRFCRRCWDRYVFRGCDTARALGFAGNRSIEQVVYRMVPHAVESSSFKLEGGIRSLSIKDQTAKNYFYRPGLVDAANGLDFYIHRTDEDHLREYIRRRIEAANERLCFHADMSNWEHEAESRARNRRFGEVQEKLIDLGYHHMELLPLFYNSSHEICEPENFTPSVWESLRPKITERLDARRRREEEAKFERKWERRTAQLECYYEGFLDRNLPEMHALPNFADAKGLPAMSTLRVAAEPDVAITPEQFAAIKEPMRQEAKELHWPKVVSSLANIARDYYSHHDALVNAPPVVRRIFTDRVESSQDHHSEDTSLEEDLMLLNLPTTTFRCKPSETNSSPCSKMSMSYLHILEHWHTHREIAWDPLKIEFDERCAEDQQLVTLAEALGFELDNLTHPAMEELLRSGRSVCSCGALEPYEDDDSVPTVYIMNVLLFHLHPDRSPRNVQHRIHFEHRVPEDRN